MINKIFEFWENLTGWGKFFSIATPVGIFLVAIFLIIIAQQPSGQEVVGVPAQINEIKSDVSNTLVTTTIETSKETTTSTLLAFDQMGQELAKTVPDKSTQNQIIGLSRFAGIMFSLLIISMIATPIIAIIKKLNDSWPF